MRSKKHKKEHKKETELNRPGIQKRKRQKQNNTKKTKKEKKRKTVTFEYNKDLKETKTQKSIEINQLDCCLRFEVRSYENY